MNFRKKAQISSFIKIRPLGAELFYAHGQTDMTKLIVAFRNFANAPKEGANRESLKHVSISILPPDKSEHFFNI
jgi:hypothetical protein